MPIEPQLLVVLALVTVLAAAVHSALGFGSGPLLVPVLLLVADPAIAVVTAVLVGMAVNVLALATEGRRPSVPARHLSPLWVAALPGCAAGSALVEAIPVEALAATVSVLLVLSATPLFLSPSLALPLPPSAMAVAGTVTGASAALTGVFGPLLAVFLVAAGERGAALRDSLGVSFLVVGAAAVTASLAITASWAGLWLAAALLAPAAAGYVLGRRAAQRLAPPVQRRAVLVAVLTGAGIALARASV